MTLNADGTYHITPDQREAIVKRLIEMDAETQLWTARAFAARAKSGCV